MYLRSRVTLSSEESDTSSVPPPTHNNVLVPDVGSGGDLNTIPSKTTMMMVCFYYLRPTLYPSITRRLGLPTQVRPLLLGNLSSRVLTAFVECWNGCSPCGSCA
eukprot:PhF_6_TR27810/c0_g1_i4/m.40555